MLWEILVRVPSPPRTTTKSRPIKSALRTFSSGGQVKFDIKAVLYVLQYFCNLTETIIMNLLKVFVNYEYIGQQARLMLQEFFLLQDHYIYSVYTRLE